MGRSGEIANLCRRREQLQALAACIQPLAHLRRAALAAVLFLGRRAAEEDGREEHCAAR